jgi:oligo-1,6-glucosidase
MRREALSGYDTVTVGECAGANTEDARKYANLDGSELNMVFHFEVNELDGGESFKWNRDRIRPADFKAVHSRWQKELAGRAWNSLYLSNHDQPRAVSRLGDESPEYRERSAKMLATCVYLMQGTPFIYQGEELGMTNGRFTDFEQLRDIESINAYKLLTGGGASHAEAMEIISARGRDGARMPMQWNNAEEQEKRADSVLNYYRRLLKFRRETPVITHGGYMPVFEERGDVMGYIRETRDAAIMVLGSFAKETITCVDEELRDRSAGLLLGNVDTSEYMSSGALQPYEAVVIELKKRNMTQYERGAR